MIKATWHTDESGQYLTVDVDGHEIRLYPDEVAAVARAAKRRPSSGRPGVAARVPGHELRREGAPIENRFGRGTSGAGRGACSCGAKSPVLPSANKRKEWHRQHKADVVADQERRPQ